MSDQHATDGFLPRRLRWAADAWWVPSPLRDLLREAAAEIEEQAKAQQLSREREDAVRDMARRVEAEIEGLRAAIGMADDHPDGAA